MCIQSAYPQLKASRSAIRRISACCASESPGNRDRSTCSGTDDIHIMTLESQAACDVTQTRRPAVQC